MSKTNTGYFFEDYQVGQRLYHAVPRTLTEGDRALYTALYPSRFALYSSDAFAHSCGLPRSPVEDLIAFHVVFGKTVPDISLNAVANLGYADCRFLRPVYPGESLRAESEIIGLKQNSNGKTGIVWVRTTGYDTQNDMVMTYVRWVMVRKRDAVAPAPAEVVPDLPGTVTADNLCVPDGLTFSHYDTALAGSQHRYKNYQIGEVIHHIDGVTLTDAEHMMATRLWQNTAKVHFDTTVRPDGKRLIYGGHIISLARALSFNGLANAQMIVAINSGAHANPAFAGSTVRAWSEVLDHAELTEDIGALRLRLVATTSDENAPALRDDAGKYTPDTLLDLDYWVLIPR